MDKSKPFGLIIPKKSQKFQAKSSNVFDSDSEEELPKGKKFFTKIPQAKPSKLITETAKCEDPSIYEYDSIYDDMKAKEVEKISTKDKDKPSRYIQTLLKASDKRKKEFERRIEKKVQNEREKEGDKFQDKESFVTSAYKKKLQEREEEEERERRENMLNDMMDVTKQKDLSGFYRHFLKQSVGEEKVPEFGARDARKIKQENDNEDIHIFPDHTISIKQENCSDVDEVDQPNDDIDKDSDIVSSTEEKDASPKDKSGSDSDVRERHPTENALTQKSKIKKSKRKRKDDEDADSVSSDDSSSEKEKSPKRNGSVTNDHINMNKLDNTVQEPEKPRKDIFAKRTVDIVFAEAQARYFQRVAARNGL